MHWDLNTLLWIDILEQAEIDDKDIKKKIDNRVEKYRFKRMPIPYYKTGMERYVD